MITKANLSAERMAIAQNSCASSVRHLELAPFVTDHQAMNNHATAYVCSGFNCQRPTTDLQEMLNQLGVQNM
ncbi:MAG: hypothetical protein ACOX18_10830 [Bacillota bacterium]|jgi:uncharacterized protein YyaL (SSP411 family)